MTSAIQIHIFTFSLILPRASYFAFSRHHLLSPLHGQLIFLFGCCIPAFFMRYRATDLSILRVCTRVGTLFVFTFSPPFFYTPSSLSRSSVSGLNTRTKQQKSSKSILRCFRRYPMSCGDMPRSFARVACDIPRSLNCPYTHAAKRSLSRCCSVKYTFGMLATPYTVASCGSSSILT